MRQVFIFGLLLIFLAGCGVATKKGTLTREDADDVQPVPAAK